MYTRETPHKERLFVSPAPDDPHPTPVGREETPFKFSERETGVGRRTWGVGRTTGRDRRRGVCLVGGNTEGRGGGWFRGRRHDPVPTTVSGERREDRNEVGEVGRGLRGKILCV